MSPRAAEAGFTLLELLVVLAVLGLAMAWSAPAIRPGGGPGAMLRRATAGVIEQLVAARESAMAQGRVQCLWLLHEEAAERGCTPLLVDEPVTLSAGTARSIRFHGDGSNSGAHILLVAGDVRQSLTVVAATGRILRR